MVKKSTSWGWIFFWLIILWPVGLFLLFRKLATDKSALMSGKTGVLSVLGWALTIFGGLAFLACLSDFEGSVFIMSSLFIAGGVLLLRKVSHTKKLSAKYKKYLDIIVNQNVCGLDNIASAVGLPYDIVSKELQDMINLGFLQGAYIHQGNREIVLKQHEPAPVIQGVTSGITSALSKTTTSRCPGCGANNIIATGKITECEYCGTAISA
ncbi:MAG TPA: hypothetical protein DEQ02_07410 [Ruminococcaceae bacterium]|nr:hypothetical protein [Oscillospiraceae bacterium]